jgi:hypothetical protein
MTSASSGVASAEDSRGVLCSSCGVIILASTDHRSGALVELSCSRCEASDIYHSNSLRPLSSLLKEAGKNIANQ